MDKDGNVILVFKSKVVMNDYVNRINLVVSFFVKISTPSSSANSLYDGAWDS